MPAILDPRDARPLTSREISKVLCGIVGGIANDERMNHPSGHARIAGVLREVRDGQADVTYLDAYASGVPRLGSPTWASALVATIAGLRGWCKPHDVQTALVWISENIGAICATFTQPSVSPTN